MAARCVSTAWPAPAPPRPRAFPPRASDVGRWRLARKRRSKAASIARRQARPNPVIAFDGRAKPPRPNGEREGPAPQAREGEGDAQLSSIRLKQTRLPLLPLAFPSPRRWVPLSDCRRASPRGERRRKGAMSSNAIARLGARQRQHCAQARSGGVVGEEDVAAVQPRHCAHQAEAEAVARRRATALEAHEAVEDGLAAIRRNAGAAIGDFKAGAA